MINHNRSHDESSEIFWVIIEHETVVNYTSTIFTIIVCYVNRFLIFHERKDKKELFV